jgi:hypothetical protein
LSEHEGLVLCHVVGYLEVKMHHVLELLPIKSEEQDTCTGTLLARGAVEEECPVRLGEDRSLGLQLTIT